MTLSWHAVEQSELFTWFHMHEISRAATVDGVTVQFKPGGNQEAIDLALRLDRRTMVVKGTLLLDRGWVGEERVNPFAIDLAASFLRVLGQDAPPRWRSPAASAG